MFYSQEAQEALNLLVTEECYWEQQNNKFETVYRRKEKKN
jgi:hypothetical protein